MNELLNKSINEKMYDLKKRDVVFALLTVVTCFLFTSLGLFGDFAIGYTISAILTNVLFTAYLMPLKNKIKPYGVICEIISLLLSGVFIFTTNFSVKFWSFFVSVILSAIWFDSLANDRTEDDDLDPIKNLFESTIDNATVRMPKVLASVFSKGTQKNSGFMKVLIGVSFSVPFLLVIVPLLSSGDAAFSGLISKVFGDFFLTFVQIFITLIFAPLIVSYLISLKFEKPKIKKQKEQKYIDNTIVISFLSVISLCYLAYVFSQLAYFFSAFKGILPVGYEFIVSEYARRGFFEMCIIATINIVLIFAALIVSKKKNGLLCVATRLLCLFIGLVTITIAATAISKMLLYIKSFGMTERRITTSVFALFLILLMIAIILRCFIKNIKVLKFGIAVAGISLLVLGFCNVNKVVADYNYNAYKTGKLKTIDVDKIAELGDEGIPYLYELCNDKNIDVSDAAKLKMYDIINMRYVIDDKKLVPYEDYEPKKFNLYINKANLCLEKFIEEYKLNGYEEFDEIFDVLVSDL